MLFKPKNTTENRAAPAAGAIALRNTLTFGIVQCAVILFALSAAMFAWSNSRAWYANNREVDAQDNSITAEAATASLFISDGTTVDNAYHTALQDTWSGAALFPISTSDCANWWYADTFGVVWNAGGTAATAQATHYTNAASGITESGGVATYDNSLDGDDKVAYAYSEYMLYTNTGTLAVYLDPTDPITVQYGINNPSVRLMNALRVGVVVDDTLKFVYAPVTESGTGNSSGSTANTFQAVSSATAVSNATVLTNLNTYKATSTGDTSAPYSGGSATSLGNADTAGLQVKIFVWLEGTDAQAILGESDNDLQGINVSLKYVGVLAS